MTLSLSIRSFKLCLSLFIQQTDNAGLLNRFGRIHTSLRSKCETLVVSIRTLMSALVV